MASLITKTNLTGQIHTAQNKKMQPQLRSGETPRNTSAQLHPAGANWNRMQKNEPIVQTHRQPENMTIVTLNEAVDLATHRQKTKLKKSATAI